MPKDERVDITRDLDTQAALDALAEAVSALSEREDAEGKVATLVHVDSNPEKSTVVVALSGPTDGVEAMSVETIASFIRQAYEMDDSDVIRIPKDL